MSTLNPTANSTQELFDYCLDNIDYEENSQEHQEHPFDRWKGVGYCCFCNDECNPSSQSCGGCIRNGDAMRVYFNTK